MNIWDIVLNVFVIISPFLVAVLFMWLLWSLEDSLEDKENEVDES